MNGDGDGDVMRALAAFGSPPIGYRTFPRAPLPPIEDSATAARADNAAAGSPHRLQVPVESAAVNAGADRAAFTVLFGPSPVQAAPRAGPRPVAPLPSRPARPRLRPVQAGAAASHQLVGPRPTLAEMFRVLAEAPTEPDAAPALPPSVRRL